VCAGHSDWGESSRVSSADQHDRRAQLPIVFQIEPEVHVFILETGEVGVFWLSADQVE
jgi:hypothetical protein